MLWLTLVLAAVAQEDAKKAQDLLEGVAARLKEAPAIQIDYDWNVRTAKEKAKIRISLVAKRPNLLRFTEKEKDVNTEMTLFDGKWCWTYDTDANEYTKSVQSPYLFGTCLTGDPLREMFFKGAARMLTRATEIKVGEEKLGKEMCRTIQWTRKKGKARSDATKLWIDARGLIRRSEVKSVSGGEESEEVVNYKTVDLDPKLPDDAFTFKPKEGAKEGKEAGSSDELLPVGSPAPDFEATDLNGKKVRLSDYKGKTVLLNFWFHD
jgi:outer membrane lipoprotein-sorting protein